MSEEIPYLLLKPRLDASQIEKDNVSLINKHTKLIAEISQLKQKLARVTAERDRLYAIAANPGHYVDHGVGGWRGRKNSRDLYTPCGSIADAVRFAAGLDTMEAEHG